ncbi:hypothetical protein ATZ35_10510 [Enterococcus rotai]|uniref:Bacteriocin n=2 Tax=Enterococcus TaxID=1350 RepID=A0A0U2XBN1_9ENTE|nr:hypothetical protein ATZ35_10510 [Enterococcus rotai]
MKERGKKMIKKELNEQELKKICGGSNDGFWERYGVGLGAYTKCSLSSLNFANPVCTAKGIYGAIKG